jgi:hypothetical protein
MNEFLLGLDLGLDLGGMDLGWDLELASFEMNTVWNRFQSGSCRTEKPTRASPSKFKKARKTLGSNA